LDEMRFFTLVFTAHVCIERHVAKVCRAESAN
jgi:hypothetical protein